MNSVQWLRLYGSHQTGHSAMTRGERDRLTKIADELEKLHKEDLVRDRTLLVSNLMEVEEFVDKHFDALFEQHMEEMPYGTAKARTGDPRQWLIDQYERIRYERIYGRSR